MKVCVVGAGIFGLASALEVRGRGHEGTLLERGAIPNPEASSTDVAKVIRRTSYPNQVYVELVTRSAAQWQEWQQLTGRPIYFLRRFDRAVVAAGPWMAELLPALAPRVRITRQQMAFFAPRDPAPFERARFPVWALRSPGNLWYGFPYLHEGFVKVAEDSKVDDATVEVSRERPGSFWTGRARSWRGAYRPWRTRRWRADVPASTPTWPTPRTSSS